MLAYCALLHASECVRVRFAYGQSHGVVCMCKGQANTLDAFMLHNLAPSQAIHI